VYFRILMPLAYDTSTPSGKLHLALGACLSFNILFNYAQCVRTDPGAPPDLFDAAEVGAEGGGPLVLVNETPSRQRWCRKCQNVKPVLAHHCSVCGRCVLKMDHHCPWMNNCVGLRNYRYFFLFLFYLWLGCAYAVAMCYGPVAGEPDIELLRMLLARYLGYSYERRHSSTVHGVPLSEAQRSAVLFSLILAFSVFLALSLLLFWHVFLVFTAQTTIDFYTNREHARAARRAGRVWANDCDLGPSRNWQEAFDERGWFWWLLWAAPRLRPHMGSGLTPPFASAEAVRRDKKDEA